MLTATLNLRPTVFLVAALVGASALGKPALLHSAPKEAPEGQTLRIDGSLVGGDELERVVLLFRVPGEAYQRADMALQYGDLYRAELPAAILQPPGVEYYVEGVTFSGERLALFMSAQKPARVVITAAKVKPPPPPPVERPREEVQPKPKLDVVEPAPKPVAPAPAPPKPAAKPRSELEEELAVYAAEDTVFLATRREERAARTPAIVTTFTQEQLRSLGVKTVHDVLDLVPGLSTSRDVQGFHRVAVRGQRSDPEVLFFLDGRRLNALYDGRALANLPVENLERIEITRGPASARPEQGAFLAVVQLRSVRKPGARGSISAGNFNDYDGHLNGGLALGELELHGDLDFLTQKGQSKPVLKDGLDREAISQGLRTAQDPAGYTHDQRAFFKAGLSARYPGVGGGVLGLSARLMNEDRSALLGAFDVAANASQLTWSVGQLELNYELAASATTKVLVRAWIDDQRSQRTFQTSPSGFRAGSTEETLFPEGMVERTSVGGRTLGLDARTELSPIAKNRLTAGLSVEHQSLFDYAFETNYDASYVYLGGLERPRQCTGTSCVPVPYPQDLAGGAATGRLSLGLFAEDAWTFELPLTLTFGFRLDAVQLPAVDLSGQVNGTRLAPSLNPRAGLVYSPVDAWVLKLLYGRGFRAPTIQELFEVAPVGQYSLGRAVGNPELEPAVIDVLELGVEHVQAVQSARFKLNGTLFYEHVSNAIAWVDTTGNLAPWRNRPQGVGAFGVEAEARLEASERMSTWVTAGWSRAEDYGTAQQARLLTDTPQARFNAGTTLPLGDWLLVDLSVRVGTERRNNSRSVLELVRRWKIPSYSIVSAQLRTQPILERFELSLTAQNVLSQELFDDVPRPDRVTGLLPKEGPSAYLSLKARY